MRVIIAFCSCFSVMPFGMPAQTYILKTILNMLFVSLLLLLFLRTIGRKDVFGDVVYLLHDELHSGVKGVPHFSVNGPRSLCYWALS